MFTTQTKQNIIQQFQKHDSDTGSTVVQIQLLAARIKSLQGHFQLHTKDRHSKRGLMHMVNQRRKLLRYLKNTDISSFLQITNKKREI